MSLITATEAIIDSKDIQIYPAVRRDSARYNSRLLTEDNFRRMLELPFYNYSGRNESAENHGTIIIKVSYADTASKNEITGIEFTIRGYYFKVIKTEEVQNDLITKINNALGSSSAQYIGLKIAQELIASESTNNDSINELICEDANGKLRGLYLTDQKLSTDEWSWGIQLVIPNPAGTSPINIINPLLCLDSSSSAINKGKAGDSTFMYVDVNSPYFVSSYDFAVSDFTINALYNKIWIDNKYFIPHIYSHYQPETQPPTEADKKNFWKPLGAVYKTWE